MPSPDEQKQLQDEMISRLTRKEEQPVFGLSRDFEVIRDKELRVALDQNLQGLKSLPPSRERSLSITKVQEAIMWLGMDLKRLAEPNPYPNSHNPGNAVVEPTADGLKF